MRYRVRTDYHNEAMVQAELYRRLTNQGIRAIPELLIKLESGRRIRVDLAVVDVDHVVAVVECKDYRKPHRQLSKNTRQYVKYQLLGLPLIECVRMADVDQAVAKVVALTLSQIVLP